jgi:tetratricopeptide (TPR) repeat protein
VIRRAVRVLATAAAGFALAAPLQACAGQEPGALRERAAQARRTGTYDQAQSMYEALAGRADATAADRRALIAVLRETGQYEDAEGKVRAFLTTADSGALFVPLGEVLLERGNRVEARAAFERALAARAADSLTARLRLAQLQLAGNAREAAYAALDRFIDVYNAAGARGLTSDELVAVGTAVRLLGARDPQLFKDALTAYDVAIARDSLGWEPRLLVGELFLEKYNAPDARQAFEEILAVNPRHPRALTGLANVLVADGAPGAIELVDRALAVNADYVPARALRARLLLDLERYAEAAEEAARALGVDSTAAEALAARAAAAWLAGDTAAYRATVAAAGRRIPGDAEVFVLVGESAARARMYAQAAEIAGSGVARDSTAWRAYAVRGVNLLRVGRVADARHALERAFRGDPYDVWTKNTLDLLDVMDRARTIRAGRFEFVLDSADAELLPLYLTPLAEEAFDSLARRYAYRPEGPVRIELFRSKADFSVRTVGLPGFGALGVSFGDVVAMNSPGARDAGAFNWGAVVWHELAHTFTLGRSRHRVPRWLSEGISVLEERRARPGWGADLSPSFLSAFADGQLAPVSSLNDGFMRPKFPEQIILSYYQASLVCEMIEQQFGERALPALVAAYGDGDNTAEAVRSVMKIDLAELDARFNAYVQERFAPRFSAIRGAPGASGRSVGGMGEFGARLGEAQERLAAGDTAAAISALERARTLFPEYTGQGAPYRILAAIHGARGDHRQAERELSALVAIAEDDYRAHTELAAARTALGDTAGAIRSLEQAMYISPYEPETHAALAALAEAAGAAATAVRERRAIIALDPVDRADAEYRLARAFLLAGDRAQARRAVLRALERAPNYQQAQELLLELRGAAPPGGTR